MDLYYSMDRALAVLQKDHVVIDSHSSYSSKFIFHPRYI